MALGKLERLRHHVLRLLRTRGIEHGDFREQREQTRVLLGLRRVQSRIIGDDQDQAAHDTDIGRGKRRISRDIEAYLLHRDRGALARIGGCKSSLQGHLFVGGPLGIELESKLFLELDHGRQYFGTRCSGIRRNELAACFDKPS